MLEQRLGAENQAINMRYNILEGETKNLKARCTWLEGEVQRLGKENWQLSADNWKLKADNVKLNADNVKLNADNVKLNADNIWLQQQNAQRYYEISILNQDGTIWCRWFIIKVTANVLLRLKPDDREFEQHSNFQNALRASNATTQYLMALLEFMKIPPQSQMQFAIDADQLVDDRNLQAHYYLGFGLNKAVEDALALYSRHATQITDGRLFFCKYILDAYPGFHTYGVLRRRYPE